MTREEALNKVRQMSLPKETMEILEALAPELAESEDERIRKIITDSVFYQYGTGVEYKDVLDYLDKLEKQKEQKWSPSEGEMGVLYKLCYISNQITDEDDTELTRLYQDLKREYFNGHSFENMFLREKQKEQKPISFYGHYNPDDYEVVTEGNATSLKKKEQKPAESISQLTVQGKGVYKICPRCKERMVRDDSMVYTSMPPQYRYECPKCGESECDTVMYDNPEMEEQKPWKVGANAYFTSEQKPEWSEEDERMRNALWNLLHLHYAQDNAQTLVGIEAGKFRSWLKSLPERFNLQPKQEWSEEDEACIRNLESIIYYDKKLPNDTRVILGEFLSNLRPQPQGTYKQVIHTIFGMLKDKDFYEIQPSHRVSLLNDIRVKCKDAIECAPILDEPSWKPSEHQMNILQAVKEYVGRGSGYWGEGLGSLIEDLKKL